MSDRYRRGVDVVHQLAPESFEQFCTGCIAEVAPDFARMVIEFAFGDLYARPEIDLKSREMIAVAALASLGHREQLRHHVQAALRQGVTKRTVTEILMQIAIYAGIPQSLNALADCHDLLTEGNGLAACSRHS